MDKKEVSLRFVSGELVVTSPVREMRAARPVTGRLGQRLGRSQPISYEEGPERQGKSRSRGAGEPSEDIIKTLFT